MAKEEDVQQQKATELRKQKKMCKTAGASIQWNAVDCMRSCKQDKPESEADLQQKAEVGSSCCKFNGAEACCAAQTADSYST